MTYIKITTAVFPVKNEAFHERKNKEKKKGI